MLDKIKKEKIYIKENHLFQYKVNIIRQEIYKYNKIEIPGSKITLKKNEFTEWFIGNLSLQDVDETYKLIQKAKKRSSNIKPILQTIALGLIDATWTAKCQKKSLTFERLEITSSQPNKKTSHCFKGIMRRS